MKDKNLIFSFLAVITLTIGAGCLWTSCDDWTGTEQMDHGVTTPDGQNPELYARYTQAVRSYKSREHYAVRVRFDNGRSGDGEKDLLRSVSDSIDAVVLRDVATLNSADLEGILILQTNFATKVLSSFNPTSIKENAESSGQEIKALLVPALGQMVSAITDNGPDGASISYTGDIGLGNDATVNAGITEMRQLLLDKIAPLVRNGKIFFLESNPFFIPEANRDVFAHYVLNTTFSKSISQLRLLINEIIYYAGIPSGKLFITGDPKLTTTDNSDGLVPQVLFFAIQVVDCGPIDGLMIQNIAAGYSHANITYRETRGAIQTSNPSPLK